MPSSVAKIKDVIAQLGLRGPYTQRADDLKLCPAVEELYKTEITSLCKTHYKKSMADIKKSPEVMGASAKLLKKYGPTIWSDSAERPWLFTAGEGPTSALYDEERFYSDGDDFRFLSDTLYTLVVEKIMRFRKDNIRGSAQTTEAFGTNWPASDARDCSRDVTYSPTVSNRRPRASNAKPTMQCLAGLFPGRHHDARNLAQLKVWLGNSNENRVAVNGLPQHEVEQRFSEQSLGGKECSKAEPTVYDVDVENEPEVEYVECAACKANGASWTGRFTLQRLPFSCCENDEDDVDDTWNPPRPKFVWTYECYLNGRPVFAYVKRLPERESKRLGSDTPLWSFWLLDGGYTTEHYLTSVATASQAKKSSNGKRKVNEDDDENRQGPSSGRVTRRRISNDGGREATMCPDPAFRPINAASKAARSLQITSLNAGNEDEDDEEILFEPKQDSRKSTRHPNNSFLPPRIVEKTPQKPRDYGPQDWSPLNTPRPSNMKSIELKQAAPPSWPNLAGTTRESAKKRQPAKGTKSAAPAPSAQMHNANTSDACPSTAHDVTDEDVGDKKILERRKPDPGQDTCGRSNKQDTEAAGAAQGAATSLAVRGRRPSFDSMYDTTPRPESRREGQATPTGSENITNVVAHDTTRRVVVSEPTPNTAAPPEPRIAEPNAQVPSTRFRVWFTVSWAPGRNVVMLDDTMIVQGVFDIARQRLRRQLEGHELLALSLRLRQDDPPEEALNIEVDDSDGWETLLELAKESGHKDTYGGVIVK